MRWRRSVALPRAPQLMFAAICSAADAIPVSLMWKRRRTVFRSGGAWKTRAYVSAAKVAHNTLFGRCRRRDGKRAAGLLDGFDRGLRRAGDGELQLGLDLALGEHADAVELAADDTGRDQNVLGDFGLGVEPARIDEALALAEVYHGELLLVGLVEAALRQPAIKRHLAAFVAADGDARAGLLALDAAAGGLALAGPGTARDALGLLRCTGIVPEFVQFHVASPWPEKPRQRRMGPHGISWLLTRTLRGHPRAYRREGCPDQGRCGARSASRNGKAPAGSPGPLRGGRSALSASGDPWRAGSRSNTEPVRRARPPKRRDRG